MKKTTDAIKARQGMLKACIGLFPPTFKLRGQPVSGQLYRISHESSYTSGAEGIVLYVQAQNEDGTWSDYCKGAPDELDHMIVRGESRERHTAGAIEECPVWEEVDQNAPGDAPFRSPEPGRTRQVDKEPALHKELKEYIAVLKARLASIERAADQWRKSIDSIASQQRAYEYRQMEIEVARGDLLRFTISELEEIVDG